MLEVRSLNQYYGGSHILRDIAFEARPGEVTVVLGRNGVGKTTLLKSLMGVVQARSGDVRLDGAELGGLAPYERVRRGVGYVPQGREIFGRLTVMDNLRMGLASKGARRPRTRYPVGPDSRLVPLGRRLLPDWVAERLVRAHFQV